MDEDNKKKLKFILGGIILLIAVTLIILNHTTNIFSDDGNNVSQNTIKPINTMETVTTKNFINPISDFYLKTDSIELVNYLNFITNDNVFDENNYVFDENINTDMYKENMLKSNLVWDNNINNIINPSENDKNRLAAQFMYFAEFWLNKLRIDNGFTNVFDSNGIIGKYEFSKNKDVYTAKFNNKVWNWNINRNYCFNTINSKRKNYCMGGWTYVDGKCFPPATSSSTCSSYDWNDVYNYSYDNEINSLMKNCNINDSSVCIK